METTDEQTAKPICEFNINDNSPVNLKAGIVDAFFLDKRWCMEIVRDVAYKGKFRIFDGLNNFQFLHEEPVSVSYDARWGVDIADHQEYQALGIAVVDNKKFNISQPV